MFKSKIILSVTIFIFFLIATSIVKNQTRVLEKQINLISKKISLKEKDLKESEFDFYYLTSPVLIEEKIKNLSFNDYLPMKHSKIFLNLSNFTNIQNKITILKNQYENAFYLGKYEKEMIRYFLPSNEGLSRRFPNKFVLRTLSPIEMVEIFKHQLRRAQGVHDSDSDIEYFTADAYVYLERLIDVCTQGRVTYADGIDPCTRKMYKRVRTFEPTWDYMFRVFEHHAGSMTTLADEAITVLYTTISFRDVITSQKKKGRHSRPTIRRQGIDVMRRAVIQRIRNMAFSDVSLFLNQLGHVEHIILGLQTSQEHA